MIRASYRKAIEYVALNDEPRFTQVDEVIGMATVQLVSEIFGVEDTRVTEDVLKFRSKYLDK